jgi:hypothetical protein
MATVVLVLRHKSCAVEIIFGWRATLSTPDAYRCSYTITLGRGVRSAPRRLLQSFPDSRTLWRGCRLTLVVLVERFGFGEVG